MLLRKLICFLFGHRTNGDHYDGGEYMKVELRGLDGIGRRHARITTNCGRCNTKFRVGMIHLKEK